MKKFTKIAILTSVLALGVFSMGTTNSFAATTINNLQQASHLQNAIVSDSIKDDTRVFAVDKDIKAIDVRFPNRFGIDVAGHMYLPKDFDASKKYDAIVISGPFGAVKEQSSGLHAQELAKQGFVTVAFDPSFTGESGGVVRDMASPEIYTEDFSAAVDFVGTLDFVNRDRIGALGICGLSGPAVTAAINDVRIKAVATTAMYNMSESIRDHYNGAYYTPEQREAIKQEMAKERWEGVDSGKQIRSLHEMPVDAQGHVDKGTRILPETLPADADPVTTVFYNYYRDRAYHPRSINSNTMWDNRAKYGFFNFELMEHIDELGNRPILMVTGDQAHSRYFSENAYKKAGSNKELVVVSGANHVDLYDNLKLIPIQKMADFFRTNLDK
ncbi:alpha/beta hydrolase [Veillonella parvula]|uniref:alpha/beta hydrolase n=1 Tax=Veillonella parvula TaxID=29466 RepID=UPI0026E97EAA|nr:alpha/beta hydrolase [Veillonella parvula]